jgi:hypothetical protein
VRLVQLYIGLVLVGARVIPKCTLKAIAVRISRQSDCISEPSCCASLVSCPPNRFRLQQIFQLWSMVCVT